MVDNSWMGVTMAGAKNKVKDRQTRAHAVSYQSQFDRAKINKIIKMGRHFITYKDDAAKNLLRQMPKMDLDLAIKKLGPGRLRNALSIMKA